MPLSHNDLLFMKAFQFNQFGITHLRPREVPTPVPAAGEVVVQVRAATLNYLDLLIVLGHYDPRLPLPHVPVADAAGTVVTVGAGVTAWAAGDEVVSIFLPGWRHGVPTPAQVANSTRPGVGRPGFLAEYVAVPAAALLRRPAHLSPLEAATLPIAGLTAWNALQYTHLQPDETVLLHGTGGVSLFALQFAKARGAQVIITSGDDAKLACAAALGADHTLNYRTQPDWVAAVRELTGGQGVEAVVETVGGDNLNQSLQALKIQGHLALMGLIQGVVAPLDVLTVLARQATIRGMEVGSVEDFEAMNRAIEASDLHPVVGEVFPVDHVQDALHRLEAGGHFGKIGLLF